MVKVAVRDVVLSVIAMPESVCLKGMAFYGRHKKHKRGVTFANVTEPEIVDIIVDAVNSERLRFSHLNIGWIEMYMYTYV